MYGHGEVWNVFYHFVTKQVYMALLKGRLGIYLFDVFIPRAIFMDN